MNKLHLGGSKMLINSGVLDSFSVVQHDLEETMDHGHGVRFVDRNWVMTPNITGCSYHGPQACYNHQLLDHWMNPQDSC